MSEDVWPKYKIVYDSFNNTYDLKYMHIKGGDWYLYESYCWKWLAVLAAKRHIKIDERERNRTHTDVWGPYP